MGFDCRYRWIKTRNDDNKSCWGVQLGTQGMPLPSSGGNCWVHSSRYSDISLWTLSGSFNRSAKFSNGVLQQNDRDIRQNKCQGDATSSGIHRQPGFCFWGDGARQGGVGICNTTVTMECQLWPETNQCVCTCNKPELLHIPCSHVYAAREKAGIEGTYVSPYNLKEAVLATWSGVLRGWRALGWLH